MTVLCNCRAACGDAPDEEGTCKGLPRAPVAPLVEVVLVPRGRRVEPIIVTCPDCEEHSSVDAATEDGTTEWSPPACPQCGRTFDGTEEWQVDEPPEPAPREDEYGRFEPWV